MSRHVLWPIMGRASHITIRVLRDGAWLSRDVPADVHRPALMRVLAGSCLRGGVGGLRWISPKGCSPWRGEVTA